jgi:hypothetical protein
MDKLYYIIIGFDPEVNTDKTLNGSLLESIIFLTLVPKLLLLGLNVTFKIINDETII